MSSAGGIQLSASEAEAIARAHGTPFYLYDMDAAVAHVRALRAGLPACVELLYCVKANANRMHEKLAEVRALEALVVAESESKRARFEERGQLQGVLGRDQLVEAHLARRQRRPPRGGQAVVGVRPSLTDALEDHAGKDTRPLSRPSGLASLGLGP